MLGLILGLYWGYIRLVIRVEFGLYENVYWGFVRVISGFILELN